MLSLGPRCSVQGPGAQFGTLGSIHGPSAWFGVQGLSLGPAARFRAQLLSSGPGARFGAQVLGSGPWCSVWGLRLGSGPPKPDIYELGTEFQKCPPTPVPPPTPPYYPLLDRGLGPLGRVKNTKFVNVVQFSIQIEIKPQ